jgi:hypothetical protein
MFTSNPRLYSNVLGRYSNTLLVSLNNRISIREAAATTEVSIRSPAVTFAVTPLFEDGMDTITMQPPAAHKEMFPADEGA